MVKYTRKNLEILFMFPDFYRGSFLYHLGANYIISYLRSKGVRAEQFTEKNVSSISELIERILDKRPRTIGFTCFDTNHRLIKLFSEKIKSRNRDIFIIAGGPSATFSDKSLLRDIPEIDVCVRGEGEYTTLELIECFRGKRDIKEIKGITFRKGKDVIRNQDRAFLEDKKNGELDIIPSPYLTGVLNPEDMLDKNGDVPIVTSRGCVYKCGYCNFSIMYKHTIRYHSISRVILELKEIEKLRGKGVEFTVPILDDTFAFNRRRTKELCEGIIKENINLNLWVETRANHIDGKLLVIMRKAGVKELNIGLESAVPRVLYNMKKVRLNRGKKNGYAPEKKYLTKVKENVKLAKDIGFKISVSTLFGFPGESFHDALRTLKFVKELEVDQYEHNPLIVYPGTELSGLLKGQAQAKRKRYSMSFKRYSLFYGYYYSGYDLNKLPRLDNENYNNRHNKLADFFITRGLAGCYNNSKKVYPEIIILTGSLMPIKWGIKNLAIQTQVIFGKNMKALRDCDDFKTKIKSISFAEILSVIGSNTNLSLSWILKEYEGAKDSFRLFNIHSNNGIKRLKNLSESDDPPLVIDSCRWSSFCPACNMKRLIIDSKGNIRPCFKADIMGDTSMSLKKIHDRIEFIMSETQKKRGCGICPIKDSCSKCGFLGSISPDAYCSVMRNSNGVRKVINKVYLLGTYGPMVNAVD